MKKILILGYFFLSQSANALDFTEYGAVNLAYPSMSRQTESSFETTLGPSVGLGISLGFTFAENLQIETGLSFMPRKFSITSSNSPRTEYHMTFMQLPVLIRYWFMPNLSAALGPYISKHSGNIVLIQGSSEHVYGFDDLSFNDHEVGFIGSLRFRTHVTELVSFVWDVRFVIATSNLDTSGNSTLYNRDLQNWFGIEFVL